MRRDPIWDEFELTPRNFCMGYSKHDLIVVLSALSQILGPFELVGGAISVLLNKKEETKDIDIRVDPERRLEYLLKLTPYIVVYVEGPGMDGNHFESIALDLFRLEDGAPGQYTHASIDLYHIPRFAHKPAWIILPIVAC